MSYSIIPSDHFFGTMEVEYIIRKTIERNFDSESLALENPFIFMAIVRMMCLNGKLGFIMKIKGVPKVFPAVYSVIELDTLLRHDVAFHSSRVKPAEFARYLMQTLLPKAGCSLCLLREDK